MEFPYKIIPIPPVSPPNKLNVSAYSFGETGQKLHVSLDRVRSDIHIYVREDVGHRRSTENSTCIRVYKYSLARGGTGDRGPNTVSERTPVSHRW